MPKKKTEKYRLPDQPIPKREPDDCGIGSLTLIPLPEIHTAEQAARWIEGPMQSWIDTVLTLINGGRRVPHDADPSLLTAATILADLFYLAEGLGNAIAEGSWVRLLEEPQECETAAALVAVRKLSESDGETQHAVAMLVQALGTQGQRRLARTEGA